VDFTGERYLPTLEFPEIAYEHWSRYLYAGRFVQDKRVMVLASGEGYGSYYLSRTAREVVGVDIDVAAVRHASHRYRTTNLRFVVGTAGQIPIKGQRVFEAVVSYETLEHLSSEEQHRFLREVKRLLTADGVLLVSTPNKAIYSDQRNYRNPYHLKEFYPEEFQEFLRGYFDQVRLLGQAVHSACLIWNLEGETTYREDLLAYSQEGFAPSEKARKSAMYLIAVCANRALEELTGGVCLDLKNKLIADKDRRIDQLGDAVCWLDASVRRDQDAIQSAWEERERLRQRVQELETALRGAEGRGHWSLGKWWVYPRKFLAHARRQGVWSALERTREKIRPPRPAEQPAFAIPALPREVPPLAFPRPGAARVSIVIPVLNHARHTFACLKRLLEQTEGEGYEVIVVDDGSTDETPQMLRRMRNMRVIRNEKNQGFVKSCNLGASLARGEHLVFLNNDVLVTKGWLSSLLKTVEETPAAGAVGAKLLYPDGTLQEAGAIVWSDGSAWNCGRGEDPEKPEFNFLREVDYCSAACLLVKREAFERVGGFDPRYAPAYYEDTDLCFSIRRLGYRVLYQPRAVVYHVEGVTAGTDVSQGIKRHQETNRRKFVEKWADALKDHRAGPAELLEAWDRRTGKKILFVDYCLPMHDRYSGSLRTFTLLKILAALGHRVTFWPADSRPDEEPYREALQQLGVEVLDGKASFPGYLRRVGRFFDLVVLSRANVAIRYLEAVREHAKQAGLLFDTVDLHSLREGRRSAVERNEELRREAEVWRQRELWIARNSDLVLTVSAVEKALLQMELPAVPIEVIPNIHEIVETRTPFEQRAGLLFVGGFEHLPNLDAVEYFLTAVFPLVLEALKDVVFHVIGSDPPPRLRAFHSEQVQVMGHVKDLTPSYERARVAVAPLRYGAGIKGKIGQSMAHGLPVVTTSVGAEGMGLEDGVNALVADTPADFAERVLRLYQDKALWHRMRAEGVRHIETHYSPAVACERIQRLIEKVTR
jgi:GT2 family glycosyltransferase/glycosyltransferase involved in cell wall biosynthesis/SAM-dependent methyltransferase